MDDGALAFPHEREVTKLARRFRAGRRRGFVVCVGASEALRSRVEAALGARLDGDASIASTAIHRGADDPWGVLLQARSGEAQVVSARLDDDVEDRALRSLDVRRELLQGEGVALLLWTSLGAMERVASLAPNLWSYRSDVAWFLSHEDIETSVPVGTDEGPLGPSIEERLRRVEDELTWKRGQRTWLLIDKAWLLHRFERHGEALATLDRVKPSLKTGSPEERTWRVTMLAILRKQERIEDAREFVRSGRTRNAPKERVLERIDVARLSTEWRVAFSGLEQTLANAFRWEVNLVEGQLGPACGRAATSLVELGQLASAERWLHEALKTIRRRATDWWPIVTAYSEDLRADIAWERLDAVAALQHHQRSLQLGERSGALDVQAEALEKIAKRYAELGLSSDTRVFREREQQARERLHSDPSPPASPDHLPERPVDTPFVRLERAVRDAEKALDDARIDDATTTLDACAAAWADEDERYRSWRLFDRWQRALARHLVARGDDDRAIAGLLDAAEKLRDLPRTRLGALLALAKLPAGPSTASAREAAAQEVLSHALVAGALSLERDARRALAPFARVRGDVGEADFHEAEADRITAALEPLP
jgi:hypothetical protein